MRESAKGFEDLVVWQKAHQFVLAVYRLTQTFPRSESLVCPHNFGAPPSRLLQILRKGSRSVQGQTNCVITTSRKVQSKNRDTI
jgi:hypothetical protein